jgi:hypothetical protein
MAIPIQEEPGNAISEKYQMQIDRNKEIASQLMQAAEFHLEAVKDLEVNYVDGAFKAAINAFGLVGIIRDAQQNILDNLPSHSDDLQSVVINTE